jgi:hypothetical protein
VWAQAHGSAEIEVSLAQKRGELISKSLATKQAAFLLISMRDALLRLPQQISRDIASCGGDISKIEMVLSKAVRAALTELKDLPSRVADKDWMSKVR